MYLKALENLLAATPNIKEIDLKDNRIGKGSGKFLARILQAGKKFAKAGFEMESNNG